MPDSAIVNAIDLPGHGGRVSESLTDLEAMTQDIQRACEKLNPELPRVLVCWSLSALAGLMLSHRSPDAIDALVVISSNPCFIAQQDWPHGVDAAVFDAFARDLKNDFQSTIRRFLSLQVKGSEAGRKTLRQLREKILQQPVPETTTLEQGLNILKTTDLRNLLSGIHVPSLWILGGQDGLIKPSLAEAISVSMNNNRIEIIEKAGHAPFLSHTDDFIAFMLAFSRTISKQVRE